MFSLPLEFLLIQNSLGIHLSHHNNNNLQQVREKNSLHFGEPV